MHYEKKKVTDDFHHVPTTKLSKDEWDTKEGTGKSMKNALYAQQYGKKHLLGWGEVEQQKNQTCRLSYASLKVGRQLVSQ